MGDQNTAEPTFLRNFAEYVYVFEIAERSAPGGLGNLWRQASELGFLREEDLRSGPSTSNSVLLVMPNGAEVGVTGSAQNGFLPVRYNGTDGYAYSQFLSETEPGGEEPPPPGDIIGTRCTTGEYCCAFANDCRAPGECCTDSECPCGGATNLR